MANNHSDEEEESGEEMEVSSPGSESEYESEPEPEPEPEPQKKPPVAAAKKPPPPQDSSSSEEEESESESEPDPDPVTQKPNLLVKPIASKPMDVPKKSSPKPRSKSDASAKLVSPKKSSSTVGAKRAAGEGEAKESKKSKKKQEKEVETPVKKPVNEDVKRQLFQRLWSEDDEVAILKGMSDYRSKKKADPVADLGAFHESIKKSLHVDVSKAQLQDKIRRLKKKYMNNAGKEKGKERVLTKAHEQKVYELSKKIWGKEKSDKGDQVEVVKVDNVAASKERQDGGVKDNGVLFEVKEEKPSAEVEKDVEVKHNLNLIACVENVAGLEKWLEENSGVLSVEKRNAMKEKWEALKAAEADFCLRRVKLIAEQMELVLEAVRDSGSET